MGASGPSKIVQVAIAIVSNTAGDRLLICRRKSDVVLAGLWEFPGGKIEPGELPEQTAVREAREELGIDVESVGTLDPITHTYPHATVTLIPILCRHRAGEPQAIDCAEWRWVARRDLSTFAFPEANGPLLALLGRMKSEG
jgi:mutator protein MutT